MGISESMAIDKNVTAASTLFFQQVETINNL
jgi:hypothetical protein